MKARIKPLEGPLNLESFAYITSYLIKEEDQQLDDEGNNPAHRLVCSGHSPEKLDEILSTCPYYLFMLNKEGQTPLDYSIIKAVEANMMEQRLRLEGDDSKASQLDNLEHQYMKISEVLIQKMLKYRNDSGLLYLREPSRVALRFEKTFATAIQLNKNDVLQSIPPYQIKSTYVSLHSLRDFSKTCEEGKIQTSALHLAARASNKEAIDTLIEKNDFNVNILVNNRSFLLDLIENSGLKDYQCLQRIFESKQPQINSGIKLPLNFAISRGNPYIIALMLKAEPHPCRRDDTGKSPIHIAALKSNLECFQKLVEEGFDPLIPDNDGNTFLHLLCMRQLKEKDYSFVKKIFSLYPQLRLTRNKEKKTALNFVKKYSGRETDFKGEPNYSRKMWEWFEMMLEKNPLFIDSQTDLTPVQQYISINDQTGMIEYLSSLDGNDRIMRLEERNNEGQTALLFAVDQKKNSIVKFIMNTYMVDVWARDTLDGNNILHHAVKDKNHSLAKTIYSLDKSKCLLMNYSGKSPYHLAVQEQDIQMLDLFKQYQQIAVSQRDASGENPLFSIARSGNQTLFRYFMGTHQYLKARNQQNYVGHTIEHVVCMSKQVELVDEIDPRPDTQDYYGALPLFYSVAFNDVQMLEKQFRKGSQYFTLRNAKYQSIFHIAAKTDALESIQFICQKHVFIDQLLQRDFQGETPIHTAARAGSQQVLQWYLNNVKPNFLKLQNDFGFTPLEVAKEKAAFYLSKLQKLVVQENVDPEQVDKIRRKKTNCIRCQDLLQTHTNFITQSQWDQQFNISWNLYLQQGASANMRIFLGHPTPKDLQMCEKAKQKDQHKALLDETTI